MTTVKTASPEYLTCADTAKLVRTALKRAYPTVKFSVRSDTYSGGASIHVSWVDGPTRPMVEEITRQFAGGDFDGMIDLKVYHTHWLLPDGTAATAYAPGTVASGGMIPEQTNPLPPHPAAREVHFGADFIFVDRSYSDPTIRERVLQHLRDHLGGITGEPPHERCGDEWLSDLAWRVMETINFLRGDTIEDGFRHVNQIPNKDRITTWFDYERQAWVQNGRYVRCGHPNQMDCQCYGKEHEGEPATREHDDDA